MIYGSIINLSFIYMIYGTGSIINLSFLKVSNMYVI